MPKEKVKDKIVENRQEGLHWFFKRMVAVFATFFVVIGVALIGLLARDTMPEMLDEIVNATSTEIFVPAFLLVNKESASIYTIDGEYVRDLTWPNDTNIFDKPISQLKGVDLNSGKTVWLAGGFSMATGTEFRSPDGRREARLAPKRRDGSIPLIISYGSDDDVRILRFGGGLIKDIEPVGWMGDKSFIFLGNVTGTKSIFLLDLGSSVSYVAPTKDTAWDYKINGKDIFFLDSGLTKGDGDNDSKVAPGSIYRVGKDGDIAELVNISDSVVQSYVVHGDAIVYTLANQSMFKKTGSGETNLGNCVPLMFIPQNGVLCRAGDSIELRDTDKDSVKLFDVFDAGLFYLERVRMDERGANEVK
ncbi:MAG: hypothetical protein P1P90_01040 [Patescibacteria group bacterium]|nr:hypothetical protein [Patescibacteria group bacterium]